VNKMEKAFLVRVLRVLGTHGSEAARPAVDRPVSGDERDEVWQTEQKEQ
jgi:hypothetical protein